MGNSSATPALGTLDPGARTPFGRDSIVRAVVAEPVTSLLVQRALVLEVAHPAVAAAVAQHSSFRRRPLSRAWSTADAALRLVFGGDEVARGAARQVYGVHDHVNGAVGGAGNGPAGEPGSDPEAASGHPYSAHDARLLTWVWATLVDTAETAHTRWVRPFSAEEGARFFAEMRAFGRFFGIPDAELPADRRELGALVEDMYANPSYGTSAASRRLARDVLWFRHRTVPATIVRVERALALATLDTGVLDRLEIEPRPTDVALGRRLDRWLGGYHARLPRAPRVVPTAYVTLRRPTIGLAAQLRDVRRVGAEWVARPTARAGGRA